MMLYCQNNIDELIKKGEGLNIFRKKENKLYFLSNGMRIYKRLQNIVEKISNYYNYDLNEDIIDYFGINYLSKEKIKYNPNILLENHCKVYKSKKMIYEDFPLRMNNFISKENILNMSENDIDRYYSNDVNIFCTYEMVNDEIEKFTNILKDIYVSLGYDTRVKLEITKHDIENKEMQDILDNKYFNKDMLKIIGPDQLYNGPKINIYIDSENKEMLCGSFNFDFETAKKRELTYEKDNKIRNDIIILKRRDYISYEIMVLILLDTYDIILPFIISPKQICIMQVNTTSEYMNNLLRKKTKKTFELLCEKGYYVDILEQKNRDNMRYNYILYITQKEYDSERYILKDVIKNNVMEIEFNDMEIQLNDN